jgi:hypothetical protein
MVMTEIVLTLFVWLAVLCWGRYLDSGQLRYATGFGILAAFAILTKGNGLVLGLVAIIALLLSRRFHLLRTITFWWSAVIVMILCGPWYMATLHMVENGWEEGKPSVHYTINAMGYYLWSLIEITGYGLFILISVGFYRQVIRPASGPPSGKWSAMAALVISTWLFHSLIPSGLGERHMIMAIPGLLIFLVAAIQWIASRLPYSLTILRRQSIVVIAITLIFALETFSIPPKVSSGYAAAARLASHPDFRGSVFLVSSDSPYNAEGIFISEIAMHENRPGHIVLRASKMLSSSRWDGGEYKLVYSTPAEMMKYLEELPIDVVVLDNIDHNSTLEHHSLLKQTISGYPGRWQLVGIFPVIEAGREYPEGLLVYRLAGHPTKTHGQIQLNLKRMLGRDIVGRTP